MIFVPNAFHLSLEQERRRYDLHDNTETNTGYVRFLTQVADIVETVCLSPGRILDYGCGRDAVLTTLLRHRGRACDPYDPLYDYAPPAGGARYDAVILCEVIEHCRDVQCSLREIRELLDERGIVVVRTQVYPAVRELSRWWYAHDMTHVNFFSRPALEFAAALLGRTLEATAAGDIFVMR
ncbi:MAG: methyltransferase domain-containing protein [Chitinispirillaceae bacterium]|nr:methyltransferase domain-containing protein [Chitinispirillaceae bacterium]